MLYDDTEHIMRTDGSIRCSNRLKYGRMLLGLRGRESDDHDHLDTSNRKNVAPKHDDTAKCA